MGVTTIEAEEALASSLFLEIIAWILADQETATRLYLASFVYNGAHLFKVGVAGAKIFITVRIVHLYLPYFQILVTPLIQEAIANLHIKNRF